MLLIVPAAAWTQADIGASVTGVWQGQLPLEHTPRVVLRFSFLDQRSPRGVFTWVDRDSSAIPFSAVILSGNEVTVSSDVLGVTYRGRLSEDGQTLTGDWTEGKRTYPLLLRKVSPGHEWTHDDAPALLPMPANANPVFEVATIKPSADSSIGHRYEWRTRQFRATNVSVIDLIKFALQLRERQIKGAPAWASDTKFDIAGEPDAPGLPTEQQYHIMMQKLLVERFGLQFHMDQQSFPVYALTRVGSRSVLTKSDPSFGLDGHISVKQESEGDTVIRFDSESMAELVGILMNFIEDRQVVDETGFSARYNFAITVPTTAL